MSNSRRLTAVLIAGFSLVLVFGALLTALAETGFTALPAAQATNTKIPVGELDPTATKDEEPTATKKPTSSEPDATRTEKPTEVVEKSPTATKTLAPTRDTDTTCTKPDSWTDYKVKSGDTLFSIATLYQTDYPTLQEGNCMGTSTQIITGQILWVPDNATLVPTKESTATPKPTQKATSKPPAATSTPKTPTATLTASPTPICYTLTLGIDTEGTGTVGPPTATKSSMGCAAKTYAEGENITVTAKDDTPYIAIDWIYKNTDTSAALPPPTDTGFPNEVKIVMPAANATLLVIYGTPPTPSP